MISMVLGVGLIILSQALQWHGVDTSGMDELIVKLPVWIVTECTAEVIWLFVMEFDH